MISNTNNVNKKVKLPKIKIRLKKLGYLETFLTMIVLGGLTTLLYLYTSGYRLNKNEDKGVIDVNKTGMVSVKSLPTGASVYLDNEIRTATDDTISGIKPGEHYLKISKKGFVDWVKNIEVFEQLVTDITAVLISQSPRLEPLTNTGAKYPSISPTLSKLAYFSLDSEKPGIWVIPLNGPGIGLFRANPTIAIQDTLYTKYSIGEEITWAPDEKSLLVKVPGNIYYLVNLETNTAQTTLKATQITKEWETQLSEKRSAFINPLSADQEIKNLALSSDVKWAPDEKKFLFTKQNGNNLEYRVYNFENPIPIGEKVETLVFTTNINAPQPKISWYSDSFHLILVEGDIEKENKGSVSLIRIDGTNKTEIYNNTLYSNLAFSTPSGDKIIILTSFKSSGQTDLYTVGIR
ncbi:PEGA domain-containing protein [candidate division WWE3 bacterium]|uniref:PEGA domain-containing protein n=1 Tax=candidate division WWE3 bacterium TaxID=2053526 RepID=A0A7X9HSS0_UNCKA|nr:PEGA domain-containing protein [candidate division WWE3 bacterium]